MRRRAQPGARVLGGQQLRALAVAPAGHGAIRGRVGADLRRARARDDLRPRPGEDRGAISRYRLEWAAATDDTTAPSAIAYDVYQSDAAGRQDLGAPTYTAPAGTTVFSTPPLPANRAWYFVVRARDGAGNRDANRTEVRGENICE